MKLGDEDAPVKIIEYRSLTCSYCADFSNDTFPDIKEKYIDKGIVNFELRPFALNAIDLNAFKLLHCVNEDDFFAMEKVLFREQKKWIVTNQSDKVLERQCTLRITGPIRSSRRRLIAVWKMKYYRFH